MHSIIDITGEPTPPHSFAHADTSSKDIAIARRILRKVQKHVIECSTLDMRPNSVSFISHDRRETRIIIYDLDELVQRDDLFTVIYFGHRREQPKQDDERLDQELFAADWQIAMNLMGSSRILCYASQQLADGNWFNVVLFPQEQDKHDVKRDPKHHYAAHVLAPQRFDWVRLHNGLLPKGLPQTKQFKLTTTKYYEFDANWFAHRAHT